MFISKIFSTFRFENALRQKIPNVTLPYWDCTLDEPLPHPSESVMWSHLFLGNGDGEVKTGPFKNWDTQFGFGLLHRQVSSLRHLMSANDLENILEENYLGNISYPNTKSSKNLEQLHNNVHVWVGGVMKKIEIGAFDPVFYVLHTFIDKVWEDFRMQQRSSGINPTKDYPEFYGRKNHAPFAPMGLGNLVVIDGISDVWNEEIVYLPTLCTNNSSNMCGSKFLKCGHSKRCASKTIQEVAESTETYETGDPDEAILHNNSTFKSYNLYIKSNLQVILHSDLYSNFLHFYNDGKGTDIVPAFPITYVQNNFQLARELYRFHLKSPLDSRNFQQMHMLFPSE